MSVSAYVARELTTLVSVPGNAEVVARLRDLDRSAGPSTDAVVEAVAMARR